MTGEAHAKRGFERHSGFGVRFDGCTIQGAMLDVGFVIVATGKRKVIGAVLNGTGPKSIEAAAEQAGRFASTFANRVKAA